MTQPTASRLTCIARTDAHEGPVYVPGEDALYFTTTRRPGALVGVMRLDLPTRRVTVVRRDANVANGLALSPDEAVLYVADSGAPHHVVAIDLATGDRTVLHLTRDGFPEGLKVDADGLVYASSATGVDVISPTGARVGEIPLPGAVNVCFGADLLFITTDDAVWTTHPKGA